MKKNVTVGLLMSVVFLTNIASAQHYTDAFRSFGNDVNSFYRDTVPEVDRLYRESNELMWKSLDAQRRAGYWRSQMELQGFTPSPMPFDPDLYRLQLEMGYNQPYSSATDPLTQSMIDNGILDPRPGYRAPSPPKNQSEASRSSFSDIFKAAEEGTVQDVKFHLEKGANVNAKGKAFARN